MTDNPAPLSAREPRTEAGKRLLNDVREVVVHGVTDRIRPGFDLAWHVARGIVEIEDAALLTQAARAIVKRAGDARVLYVYPHELDALRSALGEAE